MAQFDPNKMVSFRGDEDSASPTTIIFKQMQAAGIPLSAGNIKQFMERIRSSPDEPSQINSQAGGKFDFETGGQGERTADLRVERGSDNTATNQGTAPRADDRTSTQRYDLNTQQSLAQSDRDNKDTSAQPTSSTNKVSDNLPIDPMTGATSVSPGGASTGLGNVGALILGGGALGAGAGAYGASRFAGGMTPGAAAGPPPAIVPAAPVAPPPSPMQSAMDRAVAPADNRLGLGMTPNPSGGVPTDPAAAALGALRDQQIQSGIAPPVDANLTVRPRAGDVPVVPLPPHARPNIGPLPRRSIPGLHLRG